MNFEEHDKYGMYKGRRQRSPFSIVHPAGGIAGIFGGTFLLFEARNAVPEAFPKVLRGSGQSLGIVGRVVHLIISAAS
ncbi:MULTISPECIES: hypothetical protein [Pseudomonas]|jgi:hypothetical protein|uniref:hypothetical protein n=1 Tax=Pseudomonas TaxID=286 RepID=UPI0021F8B202|nr:hypothetical protein [Pseudomonas putida]